ncbi:4-coumarate-CoA ligase 2 [Xylogone sp. PMI_703]|nr:4-coumarate-CoA ligase 2 [Xylogone sp. PMI_703]
MPTESSYSPIHLPDCDLWDFLFERKDKPFPDDKVIYHDPVRNLTHTYNTIKSTAVKFGQSLVSNWGWRKGDVLATYTPNSIDFPAVIWGTHWAGGVISPANQAYTAEELAFQLKDSGAKGIVTHESVLEKAKRAAVIAGIPRDRILLLGPKDASRTTNSKHFTDLVNSDSFTSLISRVKIDPRMDLAFLMYSSGTSGLPKGVRLSHYNIIANTLQITTVEAGVLSWNGNNDNGGDRVIAFLPFSHIYGLQTLVFQSFYTGFTLVVMDRFELEQFCKIVQHHRVTYAYVAPPVLLLLSKHPIVDKYNISSLRGMVSAAAPLTKELIQSVYSRLHVPVKQGFGISETSPWTHVQRWQDWDTSIGSIGKLLPNLTVKYMSSEGEEVPCGEVGELWIKGPNVFLGYHNNLSATMNCTTKDGYFKTGDIGYQDAKGNFYITDRLKEMIKYKGFQVAPAELEGLLASHPHVADVAVLGVWKEELASEVPRAYVVPALHTTPDSKTAKELENWLNEKVSRHKRLRGGVQWIEKVPKSPSGKILRRVLKAKVMPQKLLESKL